MKMMICAAVVMNWTDEDVLDLRENTRIHDGELGRGQDTFDQAKVLNL